MGRKIIQSELKVREKADSAEKTKAELETKKLNSTLSEKDKNAKIKELLGTASNGHNRQNSEDVGEEV